MLPLSICLERTDTAAPTFVRCVATPGGEPGVCLQDDGQIAWPSVESALTISLWAAADRRLALRRGADAQQLVLRRSRRVLQVPAGKPVIVIDGDELEAGKWAMRIQVHGETERVDPPEALPQRAPRRLMRTTAAALAVAALGGQASAVEPQSVAGPTPDASAESIAAGSPDAEPDAGPSGY